MMPTTIIEDAIQSGIIEPADLNDLLSGGDAPAQIKLLDASFVLPGAADHPYQSFLKQRIDQAAFFDIKEICDRASTLPHMLPTAEQFTSAVAKLGISDDDFIVIYGQTGITMGPARAWWMFRTFGHDRVCVLNGGLPAWIREGFPLNTALPAAPAPGNFQAGFRPELVRTLPDMQEALEDDIFILDARPADRFSGEMPEPRPGLRAGHIPGSLNLPCMTLIKPETGKLKPPEELREIISASGYNFTAPVISTCGSGVTACVIALAFFHLGYPDIAVYDGAWSEWGCESSPTKIATSS